MEVTRIDTSNLTEIATLSHFIRRIIIETDREFLSLFEILRIER